MITSDAEWVERRAALLTEKVNSRIQEEGKSWHPREYRARAEMIAEEEATAKWEWRIMEVVGRLPVFMLGRYDPRR